VSYSKTPVAVFAAERYLRFAWEKCVREYFRRQLNYVANPESQSRKNTLKAAEFRIRVCACRAPQADAKPFQVTMPLLQDAPISVSHGNLRSRRRRLVDRLFNGFAQSSANRRHPQRAASIHIPAG
jgi:hypothetical protein